MSSLLKKKIKTYKKKSGYLTPFSFKNDIPFKPKRIFLVYGNKGYVRAKHAHYKCKQYIVAISGKIEISYQTKKTKSKLLISNKLNRGFLSNPMTWIELRFLTNNCILIVFCDSEYKYNDYIDNYKKFLKLIKLK